MHEEIRREMSVIFMGVFKRWNPLKAVNFQSLGPEGFAEKYVTFGNVLVVSWANEKDLGYLLYIGDEMLPSSKWTILIINYNKDLYKTS